MSTSSARPAVLALAGLALLLLLCLGPGEWRLPGLVESTEGAGEGDWKWGASRLHMILLLARSEPRRHRETGSRNFALALSFNERTWAGSEGIKFKENIVD